MLRKDEDDNRFPLIGGAVQMMKIYPHGSSLPIVIRTGEDSHFLLGRRLFDWEKTEYPVLDLTRDPPSFLYPMSSIPVPRELKGGFGTGDDAQLTYTLAVPEGC
jgi:hypothetical protein